jgi:hypothetical protein
MADAMVTAVIAPKIPSRESVSTETIPNSDAVPAESGEKAPLGGPLHARKALRVGMWSLGALLLVGTAGYAAGALAGRPHPREEMRRGGGGSESVMLEHLAARLF